MGLTACKSLELNARSPGDLRPTARSPRGATASDPSPPTRRRHRRRRRAPTHPDAPLAPPLGQHPQGGVLAPGAQRPPPRLTHAPHATAMPMRLPRPPPRPPAPLLDLPSGRSRGRRCLDGARRRPPHPLQPLAGTAAPRHPPRRVGRDVPGQPSSHGWRTANDGGPLHGRPPRHPPRPRPPCRCCPPRRGPLVDLARRFLLCRHRPLFLAGGGPPHPPPLALGRTLLPLAACSRARVIACDGADPWLMPHHTPLPLPHILHPCRPITPPSPPPISRYHSRYPLQQGARCR